MIDEAQDVTTETTEASSAENQPEDTQEVQTDQSETTEEKKVSDAVPYERFAEINSKNKALEEEINKIKESLQSRQEPQAPATPETLAQKQQEALVREQLKKMGFVSKDEIQQIEADRELDSKLSSLEAKYNGKDGKPKFTRREVLEYARDNQIGDVEGAYKLMNYDQFLSLAAKQASSTNKPVKSETSDGSGSNEAGTTNQDLLSAVKKGDKSSLKSLIKRLM